MAPAIVDLPQPDSPASPMTCPRSTATVTPRTAGTGPPFVWYVMRRSSISSRLIGPSASG